MIKLYTKFITKKIEASAFKTVLASTYQTAYRLYLITNGIKEFQPFYEETHPDYFINCGVKTEAAVAGEARAQVWNVRHLQPILRKKPRFILRCSITEKKTNKEVYKCKLITKNEYEIYKQIQECINYIHDITK